MRPDPDPTREERFNRLYEEHLEAVRRYVWRREPALADDVVAETFLVAWRRLGGLPAEPWAWLIGVLWKIRLNMRRGAHRQQALRERLVESPAPPGVADSGVIQVVPDGEEQDLTIAGAQRRDYQENDLDARAAGAARRSCAATSSCSRSRTKTRPDRRAFTS